MFEMSSESHVGLLENGPRFWNEWRAANPQLRPILRGAELGQADLRGLNLAYLGGFGGGVDLRNASLTNANLQGVDLSCADLGGARLTGANLSGAKLGGTDLSGAVLCNADLSNTTLGDFAGADLRSVRLRGARAASVDGSYADLSGADLSSASFTHVDLQNARLNCANVEGATFSECRVFGAAVWGLRGTPATQRGLFVSPITADLRPPTHWERYDQQEQYGSALTVDSIELAPLVFSLVERARIADLVNTLTSKVILILGRFAEPRMTILQTIREQLAKRLYVPVVFDFAAPWHRDLTETISTLAHLSRCVVADLTDAKSVPQELGRIVPFLPSVPVIPLLQGAESEPYAMFEHFTRYPWVLNMVRYTDADDLVARLDEGVVQPAESFAKKERR